jgi:hypothetical protein
VAPTTSDSVASSNPYTAFMIEARAGTAATANRWLSLPDSGYSVDNLPPGTPSALSGTYSAGSTALHWLPNGEADFAHYNLYRGSSAGFVPGPSSLVASPGDTGHVDAAPPSYYKLSAVDVHGNESGFALLTPSNTVDVPTVGDPLAFRLGRPQPNPARSATRIAFELPSAGPFSLAIYDPAGRKVRTLLAGHRDAGAFALNWDLRDERGRPVGPGMYFVRLDSRGGGLTERMVVMP